MDITYAGHLLLHCSDLYYEFARFQYVENKRQVNAFLLIIKIIYLNLFMSTF